MGCRRLRRCLVGLSLVALAGPFWSAGAGSSGGKASLVAAEQLCTKAGGNFEEIDSAHYTCEGPALKPALVNAAEAFCTHAFGGVFTPEPEDGPTVFYDCFIEGL